MKIAYYLERESAIQLHAWRGISTQQLENLLAEQDGSGDPAPQEYPTAAAALEALAHCSCCASYGGKSVTGSLLADVELYKATIIVYDDSGDPVYFDLLAQAEWDPLPAELR